MRETFWLDGVMARDVGIRLQRPVKFSAREPIVETFTVPGRNGTLTRSTGAYKNMTGTADCFAVSNPVSSVITQARNFLFRDRGYRRLVVSHDPEHFVMARVASGVAVDDRMMWLNPFSIKFDCKPQFFLVDGENPIAVIASGTVIDNIYGGEAKPLITVSGTGNGELAVGDYVVTITGMSDYLTLDCETQNAYKDGLGANDKVSALEFPKLELGESEIAFTGGITGVTIIPRWWD